MPRVKKYFFIIFALFPIFILSPVYAASKAPDFSLPGDNSKVSLSSYKGKVVYIDFWASWCKPCRKSFPFLNDIQKRYKKRGLEVIGINLDSNRSDAKKFLGQYPANFTIAYDPDGKTPKQYRLSVMPTSYLIDRHGNLIYLHKGFKEGQIPDIEKKIQQALTGK